MVVIAIGVLVAVSHRAEPPNPGGAGLAPADPYAASLPITNLQMSQAGNMAGSQTTYVDGQITNQGQKTITGDHRPGGVSWIHQSHCQEGDDAADADPDPTALRGYRAGERGAHSARAKPGSFA